MSTHVMVDLETMGNGNDAAIVALGAVKFDPMGEGVSDAFYVGVDLESSVAVGLKIDAGTVKWWMDPTRATARAALVEGGPLDINDALHGFNDWLGPIPLPVWGNGAMFDNVILENAYRRTGLHKPWNYTEDRCYRTLKSLAPDVKPERMGTYHQALDDAQTQARHMQAIVKHLGLSL